MDVSKKLTLLKTVGKFKELRIYLWRSTYKEHSCLGKGGEEN